MPKPVLQALVLADHIYQDKITGKMIIAGTFSRIFVAKNHPALKNAKDAPASILTDEMDSELQPPNQEQQRHLANLAKISRTGTFYAYVCLTDIRNPIDVELRYVDLTDNRVLVHGKMTIESKDPLQSVELSVPLPPLPVPHLGFYSLELHFEDEMLGSWRVEACPPLKENT